MNIGMTKLQLDDAVGGEEVTLDGEGGSKDDQTAKEVRKSLLTKLRNKFEAGAGEKDAAEEVEEATGTADGADQGKATPIKVARPAGTKEEAP